MRRFALLLLFASCGVDYDVTGDAGPKDVGARESFIALQGDFADFMSWPSREVVETSTSVHTGMRRLYTRVPSAAGGELPAGTMLVKVNEEGARADWIIHAMVKRKGGYNPDHHGWEWFELGFGENEVPVIRWRGKQPPGVGHTYEQCPTPESCALLPDCNQCHARREANDYVWSFPIDAL